MWTAEEAVPVDVRNRLEALARSNAPKQAYVPAFLEIISLLKSQKRTGWLDKQLPNPESISDHMYRMGIIAMLTTDKALDIGHCLRIALCHDMAEALVGDITPYQGISKEEKHYREQTAMLYLRDLISKFNSNAAEQIYNAWVEYETVSSPEARLVKDIDKFELLCQSDEYQRQYPNLDLSDFSGVRNQIKLPEVHDWAGGLSQYSQVVEPKDNSGQHVTQG